MACKTKTTAVGDIRFGQGTLGSKPPEAMQGRHVPCSADQDVFALGCLFLLAVSKPAVKAYNIFASPVGGVMVWRENGSDRPGTQ